MAAGGVEKEVPASSNCGAVGLLLPHAEVTCQAGVLARLAADILMRKIGGLSY